ncbi:MAG: DpnD/PcfM family protein [Acutalibacteraceae bacterium]
MKKFCETVIKMDKFIIAIEEILVGEFEIEAKDAQNALEIAEEKYKRKEIVLEPGEVQFKQMSILSPSSEVTEWFEF